MTTATTGKFIRLYVLAFLFFSANSILIVIIPLRSEELGASHSEIGLIMGAYMFTCMFFRPWAGHIIHKYGPANIIKILLIVNGIALMVYSFSGLGGFLVARLLQGVSTAFFSMALQIGIVDALPEKERSQGVSLYSLSTYIPAIIGPVIAVGLWDLGGINYFTVVMITLAILTGLFGFSVKLNRGEQVEAEVSIDQSNEEKGMFNSITSLVTNRHLFICSLLMLIASIVFGAATIFMPLYASQIEYGHAGIYLMIQAGVIVLSRFFLRKKIPSSGQWHSRFIVGIMLLIAISSQFIALSIHGGFIILYVAAVLMGVAQALLYPTLMTYLTFVLPHNNRNVLMGLFIAMADLGIALGGIVMGPLVDFSSYSFMYTICALLSLVTALFAYVWGRFKIKTKVTLNV